jgi:hypothetical protein
MSTVPLAKSALFGLMQTWAWPGDQPVIRWGAPTEGEDFPAGGQLIYLGDAEIDDESITLGDTRRDEAYDLPIVVNVVMFGDDEQATELRAWELYSSLVSLLNQNRDLGGSISRFTTRTVTPTNFPVPGQWLARITVKQGCVGYVYNP